MKKILSVLILIITGAVFTLKAQTNDFFSDRAIKSIMEINLLLP